VPWLRRLVAGLSPRRPGFVPRSLYVGFVVDKVALGQALLRVILFYHSPCHFTVALHTHVSSRGWTIGPLVAVVLRHRLTPLIWIWTTFSCCCLYRRGETVSELWPLTGSVVHPLDVCGSGEPGWNDIDWEIQRISERSPSQIRHGLNRVRTRPPRWEVGD
jgi:hypothetical protein